MSAPKVIRRRFDDVMVRSTLGGAGKVALVESTGDGECGMDCYLE